MPDKSPLHQLADHGQSVWIDFLSRQLLHSGELARMMRDDAVVGVTSNPTIFQKAISQGDAYDEQLRECLERLEDPKEIYLHLTNDDVAGACDLLRSVWTGLARLAHGDAISAQAWSKSSRPMSASSCVITSGGDIRTAASPARSVSSPRR